MAQQRPALPVSVGSRAYWAGVAAYIGGLFAVQPRLGFWVDAFKERWGDAALGNVATLVVAVGGALAVVLLARVWAVTTAGERALLALGLVLYVLGTWWLDIPQERLHYIEYGGLAALMYCGLVTPSSPHADASSSGGFGWVTAAALAVLATAAVGYLDELTQGWFWERRYYDSRDVQLNARAGALGVLVAAPAWRALCRRRAGISSRATF